MAKVYGVREAAQYLGVLARQVWLYVERGDLVPDGRVGRSLWFTRETLEAIRNRRRGVHVVDDETYYTASAAARELGISRRNFYHHKQKGCIRPALTLPRPRRPKALYAERDVRALGELIRSLPVGRPRKGS